MLCKIADLFVEIPEAGGMAPRLGAYKTDETAKPDIVIREDQYDASRWPTLSAEYVPYMDSAWLFYEKLFLYGGMMLHSSAVALDGRAYLFSGPSGMGKSTHTRLWQKEFPSAVVINDDKPVLRKLDGVWYAYGTPWCGKDGINSNQKVSLAGICFLRRGDRNKIRRLSPIEATAAVISQTERRFASAKGLGYMTDLVDKLVQDIPIYELVCLPDPEAAQLSYETMKGGKI
ncbi:MAG: hypothetical protein J6B55_04860 [Clostridia bacterium]|nr:hypothetical protein [Clostridia bacterium]